MGEVIKALDMTSFLLMPQYAVAVIDKFLLISLSGEYTGVEKFMSKAFK